MRELIKPMHLNKGDLVAAISISGGRAGDKDMQERYAIGKARLQSIFSLEIIETPNAQKGSTYLYENPKARAEDLMWALKNQEVKGIIANMGGDDSYRVLPFIDRNVIREHPKVFMGYSDITTWTTCFAAAGVMSYYGPNLLTPIAQPHKLDGYTEEAIRKVLFSNKTIGEVKPCEAYTPIEWQDKKAEEIIWTKNAGYQVIQGKGKVRGRLFGGCGGPLQQIMGTDIFPKKELFNACLLFLEIGIPYNSLLASLHQLRAFNACGMFEKANGLITGILNQNEIQMLQKFMKCEAGREDMLILANVDFIHRTPMTILPVGAMAEMDCDNGRLSIIESGVI